MTRPKSPSKDYYLNPQGLMVFTEAFLLKRGYCCHNGCKHCPYPARTPMNLSPLGITAVFQESALPSLIPSDQKKSALIVILHGRGDSPAGFEWFLSELAIPGLSALLLQAPDPYYTGYSWYDLAPNQEPGIMRSRALLEKVLEQVWLQGYEPARTFLFGFSQGCLMTLEFGTRYPKKLAGYIGVSGFCFDETKIISEAKPEIRSANWLVTHGTRDEVLPIARTRQQMLNLQKAGFNIDYREYSKIHTIDPKRELPEIRTWILDCLKN